MPIAASDSASVENTANITDRNLGSATTALSREFIVIMDSMGCCGSSARTAARIPDVTAALFRGSVRTMKLR